MVGTRVYLRKVKAVRVENITLLMRPSTYLYSTEVSTICGVMLPRPSSDLNLNMGSCAHPETIRESRPKAGATAKTQVILTLRDGLTAGWAAS